MNKQVLLDSNIEALLDKLYSQHQSQDKELADYFSARAQEESFDWYNFDERTNQFLSDKLVALDREKAEFCYQICRALRATRVVEAGTSFGVSTMFLAAAVRDNIREGAKTENTPVVIGTEYEPEKAKAAQANFDEAGLSEYIDLREGDLRETLRHVDGPVDFMLLDIWTTLARPALELIAPKLRAGAVVIADNTSQFRDAYADYFSFINEPSNRFRTVTLPFAGGLEFTVRCS